MLFVVQLIIRWLFIFEFIYRTRQCIELPRKTLGASSKEGKFYHRPLQVISIETLREYIDLEMKPIKNQLKISKSFTEKAEALQFAEEVNKEVFKMLGI